MADTNKEVQFEELRTEVSSFSTARNNYIVKRCTPKLYNCSGTVINSINSCLVDYDKLVGKFNKLFIETDYYLGKAYTNYVETERQNQGR